jgi:hypothetical protein
MKFWDECIEKSDKLVIKGALSVICINKSDIKLSFAVCHKMNRVTQNVESLCHMALLLYSILNSMGGFGQP